MQINPVLAWVPTGISRQAKISAPQNSLTRQSRGKIVPNRPIHRISGITAIATVAMVLPS